MTNNDYTYIEQIVTAAYESKNIAKVIVVDDGSNARTKKALQKLQKITLITHSKNQGKTAAILTGLQVSTAEFILLLDADLKNMKTEYIDQMASQLSPSVDMVLGIKTKMAPLAAHTGFGITFTGQRLIKKSAIINADNFKKAPGYLLEAELNKLLLKPRKVVVSPMSELSHPLKFEKRGFKGLYEDYLMLKDIIQYLGILELFRQCSLGKDLYKQSNSQH